MHGSYVVLKLLETMPKYQNFKLFFDNWFSSITLCLTLKDCAYLATATQKIAPRAVAFMLKTIYKPREEEVTVSEPMQTVASQ